MKTEYELALERATTLEEQLALVIEETKKIPKIKTELKKVKAEIKSINDKLIPRERFELMLSNQTTTCEQNQQIISENAVQTIEISKINAKLNTSVVNSAAALELFLQTSAGKIVSSMIMYMIMILIIYIGTVNSEEFSVFVRENTTEIFGGGVLTPILITIISKLTRKKE